MNLEQYLQKVSSLAIQIGEQAQPTHEYIDYQLGVNPSWNNELIKFRATLLDTADRDLVDPYLTMGFFNQLSGDERVSCWVLCFETDVEVTKNEWKNRCLKYNEDQPIFQSEPKLFDKIRKKKSGKSDYELINYYCLDKVNNSEIFKFNNIFTILDRSLNPHIVYWAANEFSKSPLYIRLSHSEVFIEKPKQLALEATIKPANPNWWKKLAIYKGSHSGGRYDLQDCDPRENYQEFWDYRVRKIRRLEYNVQRSHCGNLSMMVEEITSINQQGILLGRMIHLDTDSPCGTAWEDVKYNHLDLAINIYMDGDAEQRIKDDLSCGRKIVKATCRTHLLRVENVPFNSLIYFAILFFRSAELRSQWFDDQFKDLNVLFEFNRDVV